MHYLIYAEGLDFLFHETDVTIEKIDSEFTEEEKKQIKLNEKLEKLENFWELSSEQRKEKGWKCVHEYISNTQYDSKTKKYSDVLIKPLSERIESYATNTPTDEEVTK